MASGLFFFLLCGIRFVCWLLSFMIQIQQALSSVLFSVCMLARFPSYVLLPFFFHGAGSFFFSSLRHPFRGRPGPTAPERIELQAFN
jgi:hypothetical protein